MTKVALVTDAGRGNSSAIAKKLASHGFNVVLNYSKSANESETLAKEIEKQFSVKAITIKAEISDHDEANQLMRKTVKELGQ